MNAVRRWHVHLLAVAAAGMLIAGCGGGAATTAPGGGGSATEPPAGATQPPAGAATAAPAPGGGGGGGTTVTATLTGGADAGTYTTSDDPLCTVGYAGEGKWGVQYSTADESVRFSSFQFIGPPEESESDSFATVTIGPLLAGTNYDFGSQEGGTWSVEDKGSTAVISA